MTILHREMGFTRQELLPKLPAALHGYPYSIEGDVITITPPESAPATIRITLGAAAIRKIALLQLPYMHVTFDFSDVDEAAAKRFLTQFDLYTRKGGG